MAVAAATAVMRRPQWIGGCWLTDVTEKTLLLNIIGKSNGVGLARDLKLLAAALTGCGHQVRVTAIDATDAKRRRSLLAQWRTRSALALQGLHRTPASPQSRVDVNLMLEHVWMHHLPSALHNVVVPNPEWFDAHDRRFLPAVDAVWAKTECARDIFRSRGRAVDLIGFDSEDRYDARVPRQRDFLHLPGKSTMKGTERLLRVWAQHPEWPRLTVVQHGARHDSQRVTAKNIEYRTGYLDDAELRTLQNRCMFHVCTSLTEGWGHYITEALSVGAVPITVDAAPMNELVTADRGLLVPYGRTGMQRLARTYFFDAAQLARAVVRALGLSETQYDAMSANARRWFLENRRSFTDRLQGALRNLRATRPEGR